MTTNNFPGIGYVNYGKDHNFFQKITVTASTFGANTVDGYQPDCVIWFPTQCVTFQLEIGTGSSASPAIQYSFNGITVHGDMSAATTGLITSNSLVFQNRNISTIWFKGTGTVRVEAWAVR